MKKIIIAAAVTAVLAGCNAQDTEEALSIDLSSSEARNAAEDILDATSLLVEDILTQCNVSSSTDNCQKSYNPEALTDFGDNKADLNITTQAGIITVTSDDTAKYFEYKPENLLISYSSKGSLDHALKIDISQFPTITVDFDAHIMNDDGNFGSDATKLQYEINGRSLLSGTVNVSENTFTCSYNDC